MRNILRECYKGLQEGEITSATKAREELKLG